MLKGYLDEVFVSLQGEGLLAGTPMLFIRMGGCGGGCEHCDTPRARTQLSHFTVYGFTNETFTNPMNAGELAPKVLPLTQNVQFIAVTGGEPLEQPAFLHLLLTRISVSGKKVLLDSRGFHFRELAEVLPRIDVVSADVKLPSFSGKPIPTSETQAFLAIARNKSCYVKIVVGADTAEDEIETAARLVAEVDPAIPFIVQPRFEGKAISPDEISRLVRAAMRITTLLYDVRVMPQLHRLLNLK